MKKILYYASRALLIVFLTMVTQVGGVVYLLYKGLHQALKRKLFSKMEKPIFKRLARFGLFTLMYLISIIFIVPPLAQHFGRVALPVFQNHSLKPLRWGTALLNRHYVKPSLKESITHAAQKLNRSFPGTITYYLDANFPFFDGFPLLPHLSHNDGRKIDIAFYYQDKTSHNRVNKNPSIIGYGACEDPREGEKDMPNNCKKRGYWQYNMLQAIFKNTLNTTLILDLERTKRFIYIAKSDPSIRKIFLEPHLVQRMGVGHIKKIRFHGCQAVRHDDHLHLQ